VEIEFYGVENDPQIYCSLTVTSRERRIRIIPVHTHHLTCWKFNSWDGTLRRWHRRASKRVGALAKQLGLVCERCSIKCRFNEGKRNVFVLKLAGLNRHIFCYSCHAFILLLW